MPKLNYKTYGQGYPIIILHGLFGSLDNWQTIAKILAEDYMVYTIDQRDHGRSPKTNDFSPAVSKHVADKFPARYQPSSSTHTEHSKSIPGAQVLRQGRYLIYYAQSTTKGGIGAKQNVFSIATKSTLQASLSRC